MQHQLGYGFSRIHTASASKYTCSHRYLYLALCSICRRGWRAVAADVRWAPWHLTAHGSTIIPLAVAVAVTVAVAVAVAVAVVVTVTVAIVVTVAVTVAVAIVVAIVVTVAVAVAVAIVVTVAVAVNRGCWTWLLSASVLTTGGVAAIFDPIPDAVGVHYLRLHSLLPSAFIIAVEIRVGRSSVIEM